MSLQDDMDRIYRDLAPAEIPWNLEEPPGLLVELVESGKVVPCEALDLGCGAGNHAVWLAGRGFRVTGIDLSPKALELAGRLASNGTATDRMADLQDRIRVAEQRSTQVREELMALGRQLVDEKEVARALAVFDDGSAPALYVGGSFFTTGEVDLMTVARWDGTANSWGDQIQTTAPLKDQTKEGFDIAFESAQARTDAGADHWDEEEHYWAADETRVACALAGLRFTYTQVSSCGGVYVFRPGSGEVT